MLERIMAHNGKKKIALFYTKKSHQRAAHSCDCQMENDNIKALGIIPLASF
jgi:hypothetical protein